MESMDGEINIRPFRETIIEIEVILMGAEAKRKPIGFIRTDEKAEEKKAETLAKKRETGLQPFKKEPEGPILGLMKIRLEPSVFRTVTASNFVKMRLKSQDGKFAIDTILRENESRLQLVPRNMPAISLHMEPGEVSNLETKTIVMFEDGAGNNRAYAIASVRQVELMNNGWTNKKHMVC
jgi:hypothetical protein